MVRRIGVADLSGVLEEECVWRECEVDPDWFTRFTGVKGTIQAELQVCQGDCRSMVGSSDT